MRLIFRPRATLQLFKMAHCLPTKAHAASSATPRRSRPPAGLCRTQKDEPRLAEPSRQASHLRPRIGFGCSCSRSLRSSASRTLLPPGRVESCPSKTSSRRADAQSVETAFATKLSQLEDAPPAGRVQSPATGGLDEERLELEPTGDRALLISKPVRERDRNHLRFVASQPCVVCGRGPSDAHHIKFAEQRAMGRKVSDKFTVHRSRLQAPSPRAPSPGRRTRLVGDPGARSASDCGSALGADACRRFNCA
jgi:hypothetical protein